MDDADREAPEVPEGQESYEELRTKLQFALRAMMACLGIFLIAATIAGIQIVQHVNAIENEREARINNFSEFIDENCETNNEQDQLLATLVAVSISGNNSFGEGLDPDQLSDFDLAVLDSIRQIQKQAQEDGPSVLQSVFLRKLKELRDLQPCAEAVAAYITGEPPPS